jgi:hypothetical protein
MSKISEEEIRRRLELLSQIQPSVQSTNRAAQRVRRVLAEHKQAPERKNISIWRIIMKSKITKLAAAAVVVVAALIGMHFIGNPFGSNVTFAQVIGPILNAQTAVFDIIVGNEEDNNPVIHDMVMGSRIRRTMSNVPDVVSIIDLEKGKILVLTTPTKDAVYIDLKGLPSIPNYMDRLRNVITQLQDSPDFSVEELGEQDIAGQKLIGFHAANPKLDVTIWADPRTALPVRIEQMEGQMKVICRNVQFDVPMDQSLFSMEVPEGYKLQQTELDLMGATEQDFIEGLRVRAEVFGNGLFPESVAVEDYIKEAPAIGKKIGELGLSEKEQSELGMKLARHLLFIRFFKGEGEWRYAGKGVKLGDANTPIFWYCPKDSQTYRVIYGDLRVEDVTPENLPEPLTPEETAKVNISYQQWSKPEFAGAQEDTWLITAAGQIEISSDVTLRKGPEGVATVAITLPYSSGTLKSVTLADESVPFTQKGDGRYELQLPLEKLLAGHTNLCCKWTLSLDQLEKADYGYRVTLQSLIPVDSYKLTVTLAPDCGFEYSRDPSRTQWVPFTGNSESPGTQFGSCGIEVRKRK